MSDAVEQGAGDSEQGISPVSEITANLVGTVLDERYLILSVIGSGTLGVLYQARHQLMNRVVAIKILHSSLLSDPESIEQFKQEARELCSDKRREVSKVFDYGVNRDGRPYLVMDYSEEADTLIRLSDTYAANISGSRHALKDTRALRKRQKKLQVLSAVLLALMAVALGLWCFPKTDLGQLELAKLQLSMREMQLSATDVERIDLLGKVGDLSMKAGRYEDAASVFKQKSEVVKDKWTANSFEYLEALAQVVEAESHIKGGSHESEYKKKLEERVNKMFDVPVELMKAGKLQESRAAIERIYRAIEPALGTADQLTLHAHLLVADIYLQSGEWNDAERIYSEVLKFASQSGNQWHTAAAWRGMARLCQLEGKFEEAEKHCIKLVDFQESKLEMFKNDLPQDYVMLAGIYSRLGKKDLADAYYNRNLQFCRKSFGPASEYTLNGGSYYLDFLLSQRKFKEARSHIEEEMRLLKPDSGPDSVAMMSMYVQLVVERIQEGDAKGDKGLWQEAQKYANAALEIARTKNAQATVTPLTYIAETHLRLGRNAKAKEAYKTIIAMKDRLPKRDLYHVGNSLRGLGDISASEGKVDEAVEFVRQGLSMFEGLPEYWINKTDCLNLLGRLLNVQADNTHDRSKYEEAERCFAEELSLFEKNRQVNDMRGANLYYWIATAQLQGAEQDADKNRQLKKLHEADENYKRALSIYSQLSPPPQADIMRAAEFGRVQEKVVEGKTDEAMAMFIKISTALMDRPDSATEQDLRYLDNLIEMFRTHGHEPEAARLRASLKTLGVKAEHGGSHGSN